jgi:CelD/BcsL family acetyltransferase involved in cellulose biosynthesis
VRTELTPLLDLDEAARGRWQELADRAVEPNPFGEPAFLAPEARHLGPDDVGLLRLVDGSTWRAAIPVLRRRTWRKLPAGSVTAWGSAENHYLGTPLIAPEDPGGDVAELLGALRRTAGASLVCIPQLPRSGPVAAAIAGALAERRIGSQVLDGYERATLEGDWTSEALLARLKGKHRRELARLARQLAEAAGGELELHDRPDADAIERFIALEAAGWKGAGERVAVDADPARAAFFREMTAGFAAAGRLQVLSLEAGDRTLAMSVNLVSGSLVSVLRITYDEDLARLSPGIQLLLRTADMPGREGIRMVDSGASGHNRTFNRLWPDRRPVTVLVLPAAGPLGALYRPTLGWALPAKARVNAWRVRRMEHRASVGGDG